MALRVAVANGNWSSTATWNGGVLPSAGDVIASNGFTVTIDVNANVDSITNAATSVSTIIPTMTSNTAPSGIASASTLYGVGFEAYRAFLNANSGNPFVSGVAPFWLAYEFTSPKIIDRYEISNGIGFNTVNTMRDWTFEGWDGSAWIVLHTVTNYLTASWSSGYSSPTSIGNTTAYIKYRYNCTAANAGAVYINLSVVRWYEYLSLSAVAGGTFNLNSGVTVTCTGAGINLGATTCLTYAGSGSSTINSSISGINTSGITGIVHSGTGTLIINGTLTGSLVASNSTLISVTSTGILNVTGNLLGDGPGNANAIRMASGSVLTLVGNIVVSNTIKSVVTLLSGSTLNMTGNATCQFNNANSGICIEATTAIINVTGNLSITNSNGAGNVGWHALAVGGISTINTIGTISNDTTPNAMTSSYPVYIGGACYFNHIGPVIGGLRAPAVYNTVAGAINIMTGPFISHSSGIQPLYVTRMHYRRTMGSYFEFRDNSTNGALPPAAPAPVTKLVSPDTVVAAPIPANVRQGTVYALGSQTGTMIVPSPANVIKNVPVDNTVGTGVLDPGALWAVPLSAINTSNSIGQRVKNAATVESTGAQIQTTLNNNP